MKTRIYLGKDFVINEFMENEKVAFTKGKDGMYLDANMDTVHTIKFLEEMLQEEIVLADNGHLLQSGIETEAKLIH